LIGDVIYGGRVSDEWNRRCLLSILHKFVNDDTLHADFKYHDKFVSPVPRDASYDQVRQYIEQLPAYDLPDLFGMDTNAQLTSLEAQSRQFIDDIVTGQPRMMMSHSNSDKSSDAFVLEMIAEMKRNIPECVENHEDAPCPSSQVSLNPSLSDIAAIASSKDCEFVQRLKEIESESAKKLGFSVDQAIEGLKLIDQSALFTVLYYEVECYDRLLAVIHRYLAKLELAVTGEVVMSDELEDSYNSLLNNVLPTKWRVYQR
jgi:dynein heavy chain